MKLTQIVSCLLVGVMLCSVGCASAGKFTSKRMREEAMIYHEEQIMDNLVRGCNGRLMLHVKLNALDAEVETTGGAKLNGGEASTPFTYAVDSFQRKDTVHYTANPVTDDMDAYEPYISFLRLKKPGHLTLRYGDPTRNVWDVLDVNSPIHSVVRSASRPEPGAFIPGALKKEGGIYYYVPIEYKQPYFELCLALSNYGAYKGGEETASSSTSPKKGQPKKSEAEKLLEQNANRLNQFLFK